MTQKADVLIIGSGAAGLRTAIELHDRNVDVLVVGKCKKRDAHTKEAQGGINAALGTMDPKDSWQLHAADTIRDGGYINDPNAVKLLCKNAPEAIRELDKWKTGFAKSKGKIVQRFFGAATYRRACFVGAHTGLAILNALVDQVEKRKIRFRSEVYIFTLLRNKGKVNGAMGIDTKTGKIVTFHAKIVVLATGGHSRMFRRSSSHVWENNGDGIKLAHDIGASFMDMEMFQFHPTGMVHPHRVEGVLATEAIRGEGGILTNAKGERFMEKYDKERLELSARDIVARANFLEVEKGRGTRHGGVWLDISHKPKSYILKRLPDMYKQFKKYGNIDISKQKMEVGPTAHYSMGGIFLDHETGQVLRKEKGMKKISNLYAVGEVGSGVHGGNRLGGNSLAEVMVFGKLTGRSVKKALTKTKWLPLDKNLVTKKEEWLRSLPKKNGKNPLQVKRELQQLMWENVGVIREEKKMKRALKNLEKFKKMKLNIGSSLRRNEKLIAALDFLNMLPTCEMIIRSALLRKESRAAHYRRDALQTKTSWKKNIICTPRGKSFTLTKRSVPPIPAEIRRHLKGESRAKIHHLE